MAIGTEKISSEQNYLISRAREDPSEAAELILRVTRDTDITSEKEDLHPFWAELYEKRREELSRVVPPKGIDDIEAFFRKFSPLDKQVSELDLSGLRTTFLLGAGASKPSPSDIPTVKELLPQLLLRGRRLDREDVTKLADFCEQRRIDNIEDLLTAAQLATFSSRNPTILRLLNYLLYGEESERAVDPAYYEPAVAARRRFKPRDAAAANVSSVAFLQDTLQVLFGLLASTMLPASPNAAHEAIAMFAKLNQTAAIITTNYDCCIDLALGALKVPIAYHLDFANRREEASGSISLIKLHGSLNWYYCETCQKVQCLDIRNTVDDYKSDTRPFSVIAICKDCGGQRRGLLVPPLAMKFDVAPPLTPLLKEANRAFEDSDAIIVVGFSFAEADVYISRMVSKSMQMRPRQKLVIVDPSHEVASRVRRKFKSSIPNFNEQRIIRITDDCSKALPKLLRGEYLAAPEKGSVPTKEQLTSSPAAINIATGS